ncbi:MAG: hypothetical protein U5K00_18530 [Melioribacteraceae bacterium]|nr:hypothetical protein [Melioribacteraceae bacterium]
MMNRAANRGEDPHKWTNPAFYGQFVPIGFAFPTAIFTDSITNYREFVKRFYALLHPKYNGGKKWFIQTRLEFLSHLPKEICLVFTLYHF